MQKIWYGIFWKVVSCGCFAGVNLLVRFLAGGAESGVGSLPIYTIIFFQNTLGAMLLGVWIWFKREEFTKNNFEMRHGILHALRIITALAGIVFWYLSLRYIPLTQVVALSFIAPIITTIGAVIFLQEEFAWPRRLAVLFSIVGGFLMTRPDRALLNLTSFDLHLCLPIIAAFIFSFDKIFTRKLLSFNTSSVILAWYLLIFTGLLSLVPTFYYGWVTPSLQQIWCLLGLGLLGVLAHYTFNKAYTLAEVTVLLPFGVAKLIISAGLSYVIFREIPRGIDIWVGISIMLVSTMLLSIKPMRIKEMISKQEQAA